MLPIAALGFLAVAATGTAAGAMPAAPLSAGNGHTQLVQWWDDDYYEYRRRPRIRVTPRYQYFDDYSNYYPAVRGFEDRNPVPRGNIRGCSVDLGYGRYESCDK
jgi:hypothetical protein